MNSKKFRIESGEEESEEEEGRFEKERSDDESTEEEHINDEQSEQERSEEAKSEDEHAEDEQPLGKASGDDDSDVEGPPKKICKISPPDYHDGEVSSVGGD